MKNNKKLIIIGGGGHGKVIADIAKKMGLWNQMCFTDKDESIVTLLGLNKIDSEDIEAHIDDSDFIVAVGDNNTRQKIQKDLEAKGANLVVLVHPRAVIGEDVVLGAGTVVMAGAVINPGVNISKGCIINTGAIIEHDCIIQDYVHISPGVSLGGTVTVGENTWVGIGSAVRNNVNIAGDCVIGAGAVVVKDITESGVYVGVPARKLV